MTVTHRTFMGGWALCAKPDACELLFHFPHVTPAEMAQVPDTILWDLCEVVDPPTRMTQSALYWVPIRLWEDPEGRRHRDYGLPAERWADGRAGWYRHDVELRRLGALELFRTGSLGGLT